MECASLPNHIGTFNYPENSDSKKDSNSVSRIFLNINTERAWQRKLIELVKPGDIIRLCGIKKYTPYYLVKETALWALGYLDETNRLEIDLGELNEFLKFDGLKLIVMESEMQKVYKKIVPICVIAKEKLHKQLRRFGVELCLPDNIKNKYKTKH